MINHSSVLPMTPELYCINLKVSLAFYMDILEFKMLYQREEEGFAMLEYQGARIMLDEIKHPSVSGSRTWITAPLEKPLGRGIHLQIKTNDVATLYKKVCEGSATIFLPLEEKCYLAGEVELHHQQFIILDPDGYMLRFVEVIDEQKRE
ncbi:MAG: VOC family protein [Gammaproteobacteria bacterium]|nr:VOC family protein [Gammaproteobacteria bacterium]